MLVTATPWLRGAVGVDVIGAGRGNADEAQLRRLFEQRIVEADLVDEDELGVAYAFGNLVVSGSVVDLRGPGGGRSGV